MNITLQTKNIKKQTFLLYKAAFFCYNEDTMKLEEVNPFIRYASMHQAYYPSKESSVSYDCRLFFLAEGEGSLWANGSARQITQGACIYLPPKTRYRFYFSPKEEVKIFVVNFDLTDKFSFLAKSLGTATESTFQEGKAPQYTLPQEFCEPIVQENGFSFRAPIEDCVEAFLQKTVYYKHFASAKLKLALFGMLSSSNEASGGERLVQEVQEFIRENYQNAELSNGEIAAAFNYHPYHLNRLIKAKTQKTLHEHLTDYRLHMAKNFLRTTALSVTAIAEKTGFASYTYFIKLFRERTGLSPLQYRNAKKSVGF